MAKLGDIDIGESHWLRNFIIVSGLIAVIAGGAFYWYRHRTGPPSSINTQVQTMQIQLDSIEDGMKEIRNISIRTQQEVKRNVQAMAQDVSSYNNDELVRELERITSLGSDIRSGRNNDNGK